MLTPRAAFDAFPRDYWHVKEPIGPNFSFGTLKGYYIDMREKAKAYQGPMKDGFPLRNQNKEGLQLLPVTVTQLALGHYDFWLENQDPDRMEKFLHCADWLTEHHVSCPNKMDGWLYFFDHGRLSIKAPFISAMGQGQGMSVLARAYHVTQNEKYKKVAQRALEPFNYEVSQGGVTAKTETGLYFEEYPCEPFSHVLNGHIFALWGLYDYGIAFQDSHALSLFYQGTATMRKFLPLYDTGFWSCYDLYPHPVHNFASPFYHELHIAQLRAMFKLTHIQDFADYALRWEKQFDNWLYFSRALYGKVTFKAWVKARKKNLSKVPFLKSDPNQK